MRQRNTSRKGYLSAGSWIPHRLEMLTSPAWRARPRTLGKLLDRLEIEHLQHGGKENGRLVVTYDQFVKFGVSRKSVQPMLELGAALGLLEVCRPDTWAGDIRQPNRYRLTYLAAAGQKAPSDEWSLLDEDRVAAILAAHRPSESAPDNQEKAVA